MTASTRLRRLAPAALAVSALIVVSGTTGAVAGSMITGANVKDGTLTGADIRDGSIGYAETSAGLDRQHRMLGGYRVVRRSQVVGNGHVPDNFSASCPQGTTIVGMTGYWTSGDNALQLEPQGDGRTMVKGFGSSSYGGGSDTANIVLYCGRTTTQ